MNKYITRAVNHLRYTTHVVISDEQFINVMKQDNYVFQSIINNSLDWDILRNLIVNSFSLHVTNKRWPEIEVLSEASQFLFDAFMDEFKAGCIKHGFGYSENNFE